MSETERILMECRYLLSINTDYKTLANVFNVSVNDIYEDLNSKLPKIDTLLYQRVLKVLNNKKCL